MADPNRQDCANAVLVTAHLPTPPSGQYVSLPIESVLQADSPRLHGEDVEHIYSLAEVEDLPPILVHRTTMRVIDGMHRLKAAILRGDDTIEAILHDCDDADAFVMAVKANVQHGLPLSLADRKAAAARIVRLYPRWSDRAIAEVAGLSAKTVGAIRRDTPGAPGQVRERVGRDGRVRPLNTVDGRRYASELITLYPESSSREIARKAGISPSTVRDVRDRLRRGDDPVPTRRRPGNPNERLAPEHKLQERIRSLQSFDCRGEILQKLSKDPAIRLTDKGRVMLRWLSSQCQQAERGREFLAGNTPDHCSSLIADLACSFAAAWLSIAGEMRSRSQAEP
ncbi:ParB/RepB/Spo0J family partition protein [Nonomuraea sp. NPDC050536]|uniref:ParB/RepB/Spo0J family partition protein n=1 Tax=Nonomuraea sp. NPDC050536 TaxID=3364366 RepID=UPI0037CCBACD